MDLISREEVIDDILKLAKEPSVQRNPDSVNGLLGAYNIVYEKPSADIMDCARAIKEYCDGKKCDKCLFKSKDPMYICSLSHETPYFWDLPEGEKGGVE